MIPNDGHIAKRSSQVSAFRIPTYIFQKYNEKSVMTVIHIMLRRGEIEHKYQRKVLFRVR